MLKDAAEIEAINSILEPNKLSMRIAEGYYEWLQNKLVTTIDEYLIMAMFLLILMEICKLFRLSVRMGNAIMTELLHTQFLPIFVAIGKHQCV